MSKIILGIWLAYLSSCKKQSKILCSELFIYNLHPHWLSLISNGYTCLLEIKNCNGATYLHVEAWFVIIRHQKAKQAIDLWTDGPRFCSASIWNLNWLRCISLHKTSIKCKVLLLNAEVNLLTSHRKPPYL